MPLRSHSNFATFTARDDAERLERRSSLFPIASPNEESPLLQSDGGQNPHRGQEQHGSTAEERDHGIDTMRAWFSRTFHTSHFTQGGDGEQEDKGASDVVKPRPGAFPRPIGGTSKLGTFAGVFVPTTLNVLSILMFLRFGFILGQTGVVGMMGKYCLQQNDA
jgi:potassium/chloride transporter 9